MFVVRECVRAECRLRFPVDPAGEEQLLCPLCGALLVPAGTYPAPIPATETPGRLAAPLIGVLDNIRSAFNVGSIFRIADGVGLTTLHLGGITPTPENGKVAKTALGAEQTVPWVYHRNVPEAIVKLQQEGVRLIVLERTASAVPFFALHFAADEPLALVVGNEKAGVDPAVLAMCADHAYLPMVGRKESLNVAVAFGIAIYIMRFNLPE